VTAQRTQRKLVAILAADVVGYSRLMGDDEAGTLAALKAHRKELIEPRTAEYHGRVVKLMGDGTLGHLGRIDEARDMFADGIERKPDFCADTVARTVGVYGRHPGAGRILDELRKAGLLAP
jgi:class 3 adenylate cyclase